MSDQAAAQGDDSASRAESAGQGSTHLGRLPLVAFDLQKRHRVAIVPAPRGRPWISGAFGKNAKRCLPLMMANESGWLLLNAATFHVTWDGGVRQGSLTIDHDEKAPWPPIVEDAFGNGVISFVVPYLFRTPPGWDLLSRGPSNYPKDGVCALEGLVEADWAVATFTMNWKLTRPGLRVTFEEGEPFCMVVPQRRADLAAFDPIVQGIASAPGTDDQLRAWSRLRQEQRRLGFLRTNGKQPTDADNPEELLYYKGLYPDKSPAPEHRVRGELRKFARTDMAAEPTGE